MRFLQTHAPSYRPVVAKLPVCKQSTQNTVYLITDEIEKGGKASLGISKGV